MKTTHKMTEKRMYNKPEIVSIELDKEISLALESNPPIGSDEGLGMNASEQFTIIPKGLV